MSFFANKVGYVQENKIVLFYPKEKVFELDNLKSFRLVKRYQNRQLIVSAFIIVTVLGIILSLGYVIDFYLWLLFMFFSVSLLMYSLKKRLQYFLVIKSVDAHVTKIEVSIINKDATKEITEYIFNKKEIEKRSRKQFKNNQLYQ